MPSNSNGKSKNTSGGSKTPSKQTATRQRTRKSKKIRYPGKGSYITAAVFAVLGVFLAIGYVSSEGAFINLICDFAKGLIGFGYYIYRLRLLYRRSFLLFPKRKRLSLEVYV